MRERSRHRANSKISKGWTIPNLRSACLRSNAYRFVESWKNGKQENPPLGHFLLEKISEAPKQHTLPTSTLNLKDQEPLKCCERGNRPRTPSRKSQRPLQILCWVYTNKILPLMRRGGERGGEDMLEKHF